MEYVRLPFGYKFVPTDQDLMKHLQHKADRNPLSSNGFIEDYDLYNVEPDDLFRGSKTDVKYFFVKPKKKAKGGSRFSRRVGTKALWKGSNKGNPVYNFRGKVEGLKRNFVYTLINGKNGKGIHGGYIMDEFSLIDSIPNIEGYVLCRVKKRPQQKNDHQDHHNDQEDKAMPTGNDDQDVDDFTEIDELLSALGEESGSQLHDHQSLPTLINIEEDAHQILPMHESTQIVINPEDDGDYNTMVVTVNLDQNGNESFETEELISCMDFGVSDTNLREESSSQLHDHQSLPTLINIEEGAHQISPMHESTPIMINIEEDDDNNLDQNGNESFETEELVSCIDFGVPSDIIQDHASQFILNMEAECYKPLEAAVIDRMHSVDNQPLVEKAYTTEEILSAIDNAKTLPDCLHSIEEYLLGDYD